MRKSRRIAGLEPDDRRSFRIAGLDPDGRAPPKEYDYSIIEAAKKEARDAIEKRIEERVALRTG